MSIISAIQPQSLWDSTVAVAGRSTRLTVFSFSLREILIFVDITAFLAFWGTVFCKNMTKIIPYHNQKAFLIVDSAYKILT